VFVFNKIKDFLIFSDAIRNADLARNTREFGWRERSLATLGMTTKTTEAKSKTAPAALHCSKNGSNATLEACAGCGPPCMSPPWLEIRAAESAPTDANTCGFCFLYAELRR
jgi:hypothetical protein